MRPPCSRRRDSFTFIPLTMVFIILLMTAVASLGAASIFVPLFVGVVVTYVAGSLYLFKKLMTY